MENKINIAKILKSCPLGMELDCTIWNNVTFGGIDSSSPSYPIEIKIKGDKTTVEYLTKFGEWNTNENSKCVIFPKGKTTWEGFVPPREFKDGDIVTSNNGEYIFMLKKVRPYPNDDVYNVYNGTCYFGLAVNSEFLFKEESEWYFNRLATEEEKQKLFDAIKSNGYRWNTETKTLEKLIESKFKVGDRVRNKYYKDYIYDIHDITDKGYRAREINADSPIIILFGSPEDNYELVPNKFDITTLVPFESKVLVREGKADVWQPSYYGFLNQRNKRFYTTTNTWSMCIPYNEDTKHLIGTTNDCEEFYKTWK